MLHGVLTHLGNHRLVVAALACCCWREGTAEPLRTHLAGRTLERGSSWQQPPRRIPQGALALYGYRRPPRARHPAGSQPLDSGVPGRYEEPARERAWGRDGILRENKRDGYFEVRQAAPIPGRHGLR